METSVVQTEDQLPTLVVMLLKGVLYQEADPGLWSALLQLQPQVSDHMAVMGLELVLDEAEGYAFLRSRPRSDDDVSKVPRLIARRPLSFPVSLLLALLRKKLAEFDAGGGDTRLVLTSDEIVELVRVFLPETTNDTRVVDQIEAHIKKIVDLGFLQPLKTSANARGEKSTVFEVRRILKAFVDAQWLSDFNTRLAEYQKHLTGESSDE